ncbi:MAG: hypothetical protein AB7G06_07500 [Bdellovibrionales bacterium]
MSYQLTSANAEAGNLPRLDSDQFTVIGLPHHSVKPNAPKGLAGFIVQRVDGSILMQATFFTAAKGVKKTIFIHTPSEDVCDVFELDSDGFELMHNGFKTPQGQSYPGGFCIERAGHLSFGGLRAKKAAPGS